MKALIIEDDQKTLEDISLALQIGWSKVRLVSTRLGEEGIELAEKESPDVVILDLGLPDMSGFEVLKRVRSCSEVPVILLSSIRGDEAEIVKALELGANEYIVKPFGQMEFLARVRRLIRTKEATPMKQRRSGKTEK